MGSEHPREGRSGDDGRQPESTGTESESESEVESSSAHEYTDTDTDATTGVRAEGGQVPDADSPVTVSQLFELLSQPGNRYALAYLVRAEGSVPYDDLVEYVVDEGGTPDGMSTTDFRNRVATRLVHSNLPKLDDAGLIDYDASDRVVRPTDATAVAIPYLELAMNQFSLD